MNVNIGGTIIHNASVVVLDDNTKINISYEQSDDNLSLEGAQSVFEDPQPCIITYNAGEEDVESYHYGYIDSEVNLDGNNISITLSKPNVERRLDYLFELVLGLKNTCAIPVVAANSMINEHAELVTNMVYNMLRNGGD